ncbi:hypothetical protein M8Z33_06310 [Streptomyces sp. ZAF1911]|uniref:hypothetical protein n=1 Tax=Streptomyces sp. ZAF1911 TaxID=2944129 RepID=UPI00237B34FC|nr:hypothetical protein [Streptomyces sp. ZAF1911]MDD9376287.1 hypothetical protein [Streptomyces sp. ZAF1911]
MQWHQVLAFVAAVTPLALIPGTSFALVSQKVISGSRHDGVLVAFGTICGLFAHATRRALETPRFRRGTARLTGAVLVAFGVRTAAA